MMREPILAFRSYDGVFRYTGPTRHEERCQFHVLKRRGALPVVVAWETLRLMREAFTISWRTLRAASLMKTSWLDGVAALRGVRCRACSPCGCPR